MKIVFASHAHLFLSLFARLFYYLMYRHIHILQRKGCWMLLLLFCTLIRIRICTLIWTSASPYRRLHVAIHTIYVEVKTATVAFFFSPTQIYNENVHVLFILLCLKSWIYATYHITNRIFFHFENNNSNHRDQIFIISTLMDS